MHGPEGVFAEINATCFHLLFSLCFLSSKSKVFVFFHSSCTKEVHEVVSQNLPDQIVIEFQPPNELKLNRLA